MSHHPKSSARRTLWLAALSSCALAASVLAWQGLKGGRPPRGGVLGVHPVAFQALPADPLEGGVAWINSGPIKLRELKGKIVLLDFWTYCCINCHHIIPSLAKLEEKYKNELVVIGVHTPKFDAEHDTQNIRNKVREYKIKHPVINDANQTVWNNFRVNSWPTLVVLGPDGEEIARQSGEVTFEVLDQFMARMVGNFKSKLRLDPVQFFPEIEKPDNSPLAFPGKVFADAPGNRLFISDTGHNRILVTDLEGKNPVLIGEGGSGLVDGPYEKAQFNRPQGMDLIDDVLYVADTENHALRAVDLKARTVTTIAGKGHQAERDPRLRFNGPAKSAELSSPWDLTHVSGTKVLFVAMAGPHQIWRLDLETGKIALWAGTGMENIGDGPIASADFAQPSGLATDGTHLYVADSEGSCVRSISLGAGQQVKTLLGQHDVPNVLFSFGDVDAPGAEARFQHCLGLAWSGGKLYVADTYNNKVKVSDPKSGSVETLVGTGKPGDKDKPAEFYQPGGLSVAGSTLYVADTNNSKIRRVDLEKQTVETLDFGSLSPPVAKPRKPVFPFAKVFKTAPMQVAAGGTITLDVTLPIEPGFKLNTEGQLPVLVETPGKDGLIKPEQWASGQRIDASKHFTLKVDLVKPLEEGQSLDLRVSVASFECNEGSNLCLKKSYVWDVPVTVKSGGATTLTLAKTEPKR